MSYPKLILLVLFAGAVASCGAIFPIKYRYRLTVEVQTPHGVRSGSGVIQVESWNAGKSVLEPGDCGPRIDSRIRGEAVPVDLGDGKLLFALLRGKNGGAAYYADSAFSRLLPPTDPCGTWEAGLNRIKIIADQTQSAEMPKYLQYPLREQIQTYPLFVRFSDRTDVRTVEEVDPDDLKTSFGPGYKLLRISVSITDDPITKGIDQLIPGLKKAKQAQSSTSLDIGFDGSSWMNGSFAHSLHSHDFYSNID